MRSARHRRAERGMTLVEVMVAAVVLLVAFLGFLGTVRYAVTANAVAHRRTSTTLLRAGLIDRIAVTPRSALASIPSDTWVVDGCYAASSQLLASNAGYSTSYACPADARYRSWLSVTPNGTNSWTVHLYVERTDDGCTAALRYASVGCSAADPLLTD